MADHRIGLNLDVRNTNALDQLQRGFTDIGNAADRIRSRFERLDQFSNNMMRSGWGSASYTRELRDQLNLVQQLARTYENEARRTGNTTALQSLQSTRSSIGSLNGELSAYDGVQSRSLSGRLGSFGRAAGYAGLGYLATRPLSMLMSGYSEAYNMLPQMANFSQTMVNNPGQANNAWSNALLGSAQGYGYTNPDILSGATTLKGAIGRSSSFNDYMRGIAQFGRLNGFSFSQASDYFSQNYQAGGNLSPLQYATLVAQTVQQGNLNGKNDLVAQSINQMTQVVSNTMTGLSNGATNGVASMYSTVGRTGNQALINQFPSIFNEMNSSIVGGTNLGPFGQAAQWQALSGGKPMNFWQAQYLQSEGNMGKGPNGLYNWQNKLNYAYKMFGGNSYEDYVQGGTFMGVSPTEMKQLIQTFMPNGKLTMAKVTTKAGKKLLDQIEGKDKTPLDTASNNFIQAGQNNQKAASGWLGFMSNVDKIMGAHPYASLAAGTIATSVVGHGLMKGLGTGARTGGSFLGRIGKFARGLLSKGAGNAVAGGLDATGTALELGGTAADATGVGAIGGIPANILGALLLSGGAAVTGITGWLGSRHNSSAKNSSSKSSSSTSVKLPTDIQSEVSNVVAVLMALRPWAGQISQWYSGSSSSGGSGSTFALGNATQQNSSSSFIQNIPNAKPMTTSNGSGMMNLTDNANSGTTSLSGSIASGKSGVSQYASLINKYAGSSGVPAKVLGAIMQTETGGNPYDIDDDTTGKSYTGLSRSQYLSMTSKLLGEGHNIDMGLMQINSSNGISAAQAADPNSAIKWASNYLKTGYDATGSWNDAIRYYNGGPKGWDTSATLSYLQKTLANEQKVNVSVSAPQKITIQLKDSSGKDVGGKIISLTTKATYQGQA